MSCLHFPQVRRAIFPQPSEATMVWYILSFIFLIGMVIVFVVLLAKHAEEPVTRHTEPGQGKPPEVKEQ